ncbi:MAG: beta strand repeat-containing protein, partial [Roseimicrobium sp.]
MKLGSATALGSSANLNHTIVASGATLDLNGQTIAEQFGQSTTTFSDGFGSATAILTNSSATAASITGDINFDGGGAFTVNGTGDISLTRLRRANGSSGDPTITKEGSNTLILGGTADNTAAAVIVNAGVVQLNKAVGSGVRALGGSTTTIGAAGTLRLTNGQANVDQIFANVTLANNGIFDLQGQNESFNIMNGTGLVTNGATNDPSVLTLGENNSGFTWGGVIQDGAGTSTLSLVKMGNGTMTITGTNTYKGATTINGFGGGLTLDFANAAGTTNLISADSALTMTNTSGVRTQTLTVTGKASTTNSQTFNSTSITGTGTRHRIVVTSGASGTTTLALGALTLSNSPFVDFGLPTAGAITTSNADAVLGPRVTINNGANYAQISSGVVTAYSGNLTYQTGANISALVGYDATDDLLVDNTSTGNVLQAAGTTGLNTIQFTDAASRTFTLGAGNTLQLGATGGILRGSTAGSVTIGEPGNAGTLTTGTSTGADLILTNGNATGTLTVNSVIANNAGGAVNVFVNGSGTTVLAGANTTTGAITVQAGTLRAAHDSALGNAAGGVSVLDGATLELSGGITIGDEALSLSGTGVGSNGALRILSGTSTYGGLVTAAISTEIQAETGTTLIFDRTGTNPSITSANNSLTFDTIGTGVITFNDAINITSSSNPTVTKGGTGTLNLTVANSWAGSGAFTLNDGVVRISHGSALGGTSGGTSITDNAALELVGGI